MLNEANLFIGADSPEVLPVIDKVIFLLLSFPIGEGYSRLFAQSKVCEHIIKPLAGVGEQGISQSYGHLAVKIANVVKIKVYQAHLKCGGHNLPTTKGLFLYCPHNRGRFILRWKPVFSFA